MSNEETRLMEAAMDAWKYLMIKSVNNGTSGGSKLPTSAGVDYSSSSRHVHEDCSIVILLDMDGTYMTCRPQSMDDWPKITTLNFFRIDYIKILPVGRQSAASVQITVGNQRHNDHADGGSGNVNDDDTNNGDSEMYRGFMIFLQDGVTTTIHDSRTTDALMTTTTTWKCISLSLAPHGDDIYNNGPSNKVVPSSFQDVCALVWDGYCHANRCCDGNEMAQHFHPTCRLTYSTQQQQSAETTIVICESDEFYDKVQHRYMTSPHKEYQHLKDHPNVGNWDGLNSIEFATPHLSLVVLTVGHPPFLWTDLLTCAYLGRRRSIGDESGVELTIDEPAVRKWWIIHKSSECECHPLTKHDQ